MSEDMFLVECRCGYLFDNLELYTTKRCPICNKKLPRYRKFKKMAKRLDL